MSAPNQGRQSPEPERQSEAQAGAVADPNTEGSDQTAKDDQKDGEDALKHLESNPTPALHEHQEAATAKGVGRVDG